MDQQLIEKQVLYNGQKVRLEVHHFEDEQGRRHKKEICVHRGAVVVAPFLDVDTILLIRNFRYSIGQYLVELPAGTLEPKEDPMNAAGRELLEETGYIAGRFKPLEAFYASPGILTEKLYGFAAYDLEKSTQRLEVGEEIEPLPTAWDEALQMIRDGRICDAKTIAILLLFNQFHRGGQ